MSLLRGVPHQGGTPFIGACPDSAEATIVLLGAPLDLTGSFRPGARYAPQAIRSVSEALETYSLHQQRDLRDCFFFDVGDLVLPPGNLERSIQLIWEAVSGLAVAGKCPFLLGGEHLITVPAVKALLDLHPDLVVLHFDAHADLRRSYMGERDSHATVVRRLLDLGCRDIYQFGIRSATAEEETIARRGHFYPFSVAQPVRSIRGQWQGKPVYITLDIDVVDPGFAPGTGTPEPGGVTAMELLSTIPLLRGCNVVGMDLVEVSPPYDAAQITALLAAKLVRELIIAVDQRGPCNNKMAGEVRR